MDIHEALGADERAIVIGHDWGAVAASGVSSYAPQLFSAVVLLAVTPLRAVAAVFWPPRPRNLPLIHRQLPHSWYMGVAQIPVLSELFGDPLIRLLWALWAPGYDYRDDLESVRKALPDKDRRRAALAWYRAVWNPLYRSRKYAEEQRHAYDRARVRTLYLRGIPRTGHFLHLEDPHTVNRAIAEFVGRAATVGSSGR
ncbi:alpha/beta fold hydrolase [Rhodococcus sp. WS4]|nr:alpha/beta fold hydrolase [Rhodococcus sp. WS4]